MQSPTIATLSEASRDELLAAVASLTRELAEVRQQQAATTDVLRAINRTDFDLDAILNTLTKSAADLCEAGSSSLFLRSGDKLFARGTANLDAEQDVFVRGTAAPVDESSYIGRAVLHGTVANIPDFLAWSGSRLTMYQQKLGFRALLVVPLMRDGHGVGVFTLASKRLGEFTTRQVELVQIFAAQAAIAVQNASLVDELQARTDELAHSLTQLDETRERLTRSERLGALGRLVAGVSHEMNTPVGTALTIATTFEHDVERLAEALEAGRLGRSDLTRGLRRLVQGAALVRTNLARAIRLIQRFRLVASDRPGGERCLIDVRPWAEGLLRNHQALSASPHDYVVACQDGFATAGYREKWTQIVDCLVENSLQHAFGPDETGTITLTVGVGGPGRVLLDYGDSGRGISADAIGHIFDPFYTTARGTGAAGLGLHIVHNLVASMGGDISVTSGIGGGASFRITLPTG